MRAGGSVKSEWARHTLASWNSWFTPDGALSIAVPQNKRWQVCQTRRSSPWLSADLPPSPIRLLTPTPALLRFETFSWQAGFYRCLGCLLKCSRGVLCLAERSARRLPAAHRKTTSPVCVCGSIFTSLFKANQKFPTSDYSIWEWRDERGVPSWRLLTGV